MVDGAGCWVAKRFGQESGVSPASGRPRAAYDREVRVEERGLRCEHRRRPAPPRGAHEVAAPHRYRRPRRNHRRVRPRRRRPHRRGAASPTRTRTCSPDGSPSSGETAAAAAAPQPSPQSTTTPATSTPTTTSTLGSRLASVYPSRLAVAVPNRCATSSFRPYGNRVYAARCGPNSRRWAAPSPSQAAMASSGTALATARMAPVAPSDRAYPVSAAEPT